MSAVEETSAGASAAQQSDFLQVNDLRMYFPVTEGIVIQRKVAEVKAVDGISFAMHKGETLGLVGESGCGKTTTGRCILQLEKITSGSIKFDGNDVTAFNKAQMSEYRQNVQVIFQDPFSSLNPRMKIGEILAEPMRVHGIIPDKQGRDKRVMELLNICGLSTRFADRYPHEMSGGQRQRVGIARALSVDPQFIVCDEAVSALDVSVQSQVINLLQDLQDELGLTYLFVAHDLSVVHHISDRIAVMYLGNLIEIGNSDAVYLNPAHPYSRALVSAVPRPDPKSDRSDRQMLEGEIPTPLNKPSGCAFRTRCPIAQSECALTVPVLESKKDGQLAACPLT